MCCLRQDNILKQCYFIVDKRKSETLLPIIVQEIEPETTIYSDKWRAFSTLKYNGILHQIVNHGKNFIDPRTGALTQISECLWKLMKVKYDIRSRGATNLLERQLSKRIAEIRQSKKNVFKCFYGI